MLLVVVSALFTIFGIVYIGLVLSYIYYIYCGLRTDLMNMYQIYAWFLALGVACVAYIYFDIHMYNSIHNKDPAVVVCEASNDKKV